MLTLSEYAKPDSNRGLREFLITFIPFLVFIFLGFLSLNDSNLVGTLICGFLAVLFHARLFVIMHDCGHGFFVQPSWFNNILGHLCALTYGLPFFVWRELHHRHHRNQGNLDRRGLSYDLWIMTRTEFSQASTFKKIFYRIYHFPFCTFFLGGLFFFIILMRFPFENFSGRARLNLVIVNLIWVYLIGVFAFVPQLRDLFYFCGAVVIINFVQAIWYFYHQHIHPQCQWYSQKDYSNELVSISGSTYILFPKWIHWFSANIGYHHVHHLNPRVPLYRLPMAHQKIEHELRQRHAVAIQLHWRELFSHHRCHLWDTEKSRWVSFSEYSEANI